MSSLRRSLLTGGAERAISGALGLLAVPFHAALLGVEGYGLLSFVTSLQVLANIIDFGLGPMVVRELSSDTDPARLHSHRVVATLGFVYWTIAVALGLLILLIAPYLASSWLEFAALAPGTVIAAIQLTAAYILLRWPIALYAGVIAGAQRIDLANVIRISITTVRIAVGLVVMFVSRSVVAYLVWLVITAVIELSINAAAVARLMSARVLRPTISRSAVRRVWRFSAQMNVMSILAAVFVQGDRVVISGLRSVTELGTYSLAYNIGSGITLAPTVITTALFPQLARDMALGNTDRVRASCYLAQQALMYVVSGLTAVLLFWGRDILLVIAPNIHDGALVPLLILSAGFFFAATAAIPYTLAVAAGRVEVPLRLNSLAAIAYVPGMYYLVSRFGIAGAAIGWLLLNAFYAIVMVPYLHRILPLRTTSASVFGTIVPFITCACGIVGLGRGVTAAISADGTAAAAILAISAVSYAVFGAMLLDARTKAHFRHWIVSLLDSREGFA